MNLTGIITEYNPFHNGHMLHLNTAKKICNSDGIVCIMSGNFVQRGEAAILDKWTRAKMAVENGVDLIIELPTFYALSSAENFAFGAVSILNSLNCIDNIFFGSECGELEKLKEIANVLTFESDDFKEVLKYNLDKGLSFPAAREAALKDYFKDSHINISQLISASNNILGIEYIKSLLSLKSNIVPKTFKREGSNYNDKELSNSLASATSIRYNIKKYNNLNLTKDFLPKKSFDILCENLNNSLYSDSDERIFEFIRYKLISSCINFNNLSGVKEGLDNKFIKEIYNSSSLDEFIQRCKSKRYTYTNLSRLLMKIFIGFDNFNESLLKDPKNLYCRVLAFNSTGREILKLIKNNSSIQLITKVGKHPNNPLLELDIQATRVYSLINNSIDPNSDYFKSPIIFD